MSRFYLKPRKETDDHVVVGWDRYPCGFFFQVWEKEGEDEEYGMDSPRKRGSGLTAGEFFMEAADYIDRDDPFTQRIFDCIAMDLDPGPHVKRLTWTEEVA